MAMYDGKEAGPSNFAEVTNDESSFFPLALVTDKKTEMYVKFAKVMIIFQGDVKSDNLRHAVNAIHEKFRQACHEISELCYKKSLKIDRINRRHEFYEYCKNQAKNACEKGINLIFINQFEREISLNQYFLYLAQRAKYVVLVYPPIATDNCSLTSNYNARLRINKDFIIETHLFCGWFLNDIDSQELRDEAAMYFNDCCSSISEFKRFYEKVDPDEDFQSFYGLNVKRQDLGYCVMKLFSSVLSAFTYFKKPRVCKEYGKRSTLLIIGFVFSPSMLAARVKVTYNQKDLYEMQDIKREGGIKQFPSQLFENSKINLDEHISIPSSKGKRSLHDSGTKMHDPFQNIRGRGRAAHIVLAKSKAATYMDIDNAVLEAVTREDHVSEKDVETHEIRNALVRRIGKYWILYLTESLAVDAMFGSCFKV